MEFHLNDQLYLLGSTFVVIFSLKVIVEKYLAVNEALTFTGDADNSRQEHDVWK